MASAADKKLTVLRIVIRRDEKRRVWIVTRRSWLGTSWREQVVTTKRLLDLIAETVGTVKIR